ncbi:hypothetical protein, partial [Winogradskyella sp.]|uniref:hypothetical protein n=1 Tax=Winogradskyella sp. TaxID=1883156 RepID=UPI0025E2B183
MCIIHKGFRGFQALSLASKFGGNLTGLKSEIPYEIIHETLVCNCLRHVESRFANASFLLITYQRPLFVAPRRF